jgi:hypothetical protein
MKDSLEANSPRPGAEFGSSLGENVLKLRLRAADSALGAAASKTIGAIPRLGPRARSFAGPAIVMALVFGVSLMAGSYLLAPARLATKPQNGEIADAGQAARKMAEQIAMHKTDDPSARAARSASVKEEPTPKPRAEATPAPASAAISEPPVRGDASPPKSASKPSASEKVDAIGRKIASLPAVERLASATPATAKRANVRRGDAFDPSKNPGAPGAPHPLGTTAPSRPLDN